MFVERSEYRVTDLLPPAPIEHFASREKMGMDGYVLELEDRSPLARDVRRRRRCCGHKGWGSGVGHRQFVGRIRIGRRQRTCRNLKRIKTFLLCVRLKRGISRRG